MTLINALNDLKSAGITRLVGMCDTTDINAYIHHAERNHANAVKWGTPDSDDVVRSWTYALEHEDDNRMINTEDGHHIIATRYDGFEMATYSDYATEEEMHTAFEEIQVMEQAEAIADEMTAKRPGELPRSAWVLIATAELKAASKAASAAFEREYGTA